MTEKYLPEARRAIVEMLENAMTAWVASMQEQSFGNPYDDESLNMMLDATATSLSKLLAKSPNRAALLQTYALNILDQVEK